MPRRYGTDDKQEPLTLDPQALESSAERSRPHGARRILCTLRSKALSGAGARRAQLPGADGTSDTVTGSTKLKLKALPPGSFYTEPPARNHFAETGYEPVEVQITGFGPSSTEYVDPSQDPRAQHR